MASLHEKDEGYYKFAQLYVTLETQSTLNEKYAEHILQQQGNINYQLPANTALASSNPEFIGCTALHLAYKRDQIKIFNLLSKYGADCTVENHKGLSVLREIIADICEKNAVDNAYLNSILEAYVGGKTIFKTPYNYDLTFFHAACISGKFSYVKSCLKTVTAIDQLVGFPNFEGYTSLHLAVQYCNHEVIEILLKNQPNLKLKNSKKLTPLQMALERHVQNRNEHLDDEKIVNQLLKAHNKKTGIIDETGLSFLHVACTLKSTSMLESVLTKFQNVDETVHSNSPIFPGYSALHFAAICNLQAVKLLMKKGANILLKNSNGKTAFDFCMERYEINDIHNILCIRPLFQNISLTNGIKLLDLILFMQRSDERLLSNIPNNVHVSFNSPLWPRYSILHVAVMFAEKKCQNNNRVIKQLDVNRFMKCRVQDDEFPLHLAFRLNKTVAVNTLLDHIIFESHNAANKDNLTFLHIACVVGKQEVVDRLLLNDNEVNRKLQADYNWGELYIPKGSTALHIAVTVNNYKLTSKLLSKGANPRDRDTNGMTPIHCLMVSKNSSKLIADLLLTPPKLPESEVEPPAAKKKKRNRNRNNLLIQNTISPNNTYLVKRFAKNGLTHLHVASFFGNEEAVDKFLQSSLSIIDATINSGNVVDATKFPGLVGYAGCTALDLAMKNNHQNVVHLLLSKGANMLLDKPDGSNPLIDVLIHQPKYNARVFIDFIEKNHELRNQIYRKMGLTMLHLYTFIGYIEPVKKFLDKHNFIDTPINLDSPIWPGFMALHILMRDYQTSSYQLLGLLLDKGGDVTKMNADGYTPLHLAYYSNIDTNDKVQLMTLLMRHQKVFQDNPTDKKGLSHFHIACALDDMEAIKKYLKYGADVNQPVDHFHDGKLAGCTPLHLSLNSPFNQGVDGVVKLQAIDLLIKHGAVVQAKDTRGNTPLYFAVKCDLQYMALMKRLLDAGARNDEVNMMGQTVFEKLLNSTKLSVEDVQFFLTCGCRINNFNLITQRGYMAIAVSKYLNARVNRLIFEKILEFECVKEVDELGRNAIHNVISTSRQLISGDFYADMIQKLLKLGCDIDHQDRLGRTPLHIATQFRNHRGIIALLNAGANVNIIDISRKTAFAYAIVPSTISEEHKDNSKEIVQTFAYHLQKLNLCLLDVHETIHKILAEASQNYAIDVNLPSSFSEQLMMLKSFKIDKTELTLFDFISETKAVVTYSTLSRSQRLAADKSLESINATSFPELIGIIKLQYRKALRRQKSDVLMY